MKKLLTLVLCLALVCAAFSGCAAQTAPEPSQTAPADNAPSAPADTAAAPVQDNAVVKIVALQGPTGMGMARLMDQSAQKAALHDYQVQLCSAPDEIVGKIATGEVDIAAAPINLAAVLYQKTQGDVQLLALNTLGVLYVLENGQEIQSVADLAGKTLLCTGQGSTPEYVLHYILEQNGIADQVKVEYKSEHSELATLLVSGDAKLGMLPEPNVTAVTMKNSDVRVALNLTQEWNKVSGGTPLVQGCLIVRKDFAQQHPDLVQDFLQEYADSTAFTNEQPAEAAALMEQYGVLPNAAAAEKTIPNANIVCVTGAEMKQDAAAMFDVLFAANPASVGGQLPPDDFYFGA